MQLHIEHCHTCEQKIIIGVNFIRKVGAYGELEARTYNMGLEAQPPVKSRDRAPGEGVRRQTPLKLKAFSYFRSANETQICPCFVSH